MENKGLVQVYTGNGKGKTTAAFGQALRAAGSGLGVIIIQFVKGDSSCGEHLFASKYGAFELVQPNKEDCFFQGPEELQPVVSKTLEAARRALSEERYDVVILDEIFVAVHLGLVTVTEVLDLMGMRPVGVELILTGRDAPAEVVRRADLVTEMVAVKHPFDRGVQSRKGIEC
ncbi:MAG: cob(I)yrinic acid a,c-diamide adenosyltransferase [Chloroflexota bacterium]